jgi:hypothetical protein
MDNALGTTITPALVDRICADIRQGAYVTVACQRAGISGFTYYRWLNLGRADAETRAQALAQGELVGEPTIFEQFYTAVETAKADARFGAEVSVYQAWPLQWLKSGYARRDWHEYGTSAAEIVDEIERRIAAGPTSLPVPPESVRTVLRMLIESGVAHLPEASPTETANDSESTEETG